MKGGGNTIDRQGSGGGTALPVARTMARGTVRGAHKAARVKRDAMAVQEGLRHHAAASRAGSADRSSGSALPAAFAASRKCAMRDDGMPIDRQLCTVETGASISLATADVPPK